MDLSTRSQIVNAKGVPGTLGCLARSRHDAQPVLLTVWHVLFGNGARPADPIWRRVSKHQFLRIGRTLYGKLGTGSYAGQNYYMDCAVASYQAPVNEDTSRGVAGCSSAMPGDVVIKNGAASGVTRGIIVDVNYSNAVIAGGLKHDAERQLLVRPLDPDQPFAVEGDSGALVVDSCNRAVGLLWGMRVNGEGVVTPIAPILFALNIELQCPG